VSIPVKAFTRAVFPWSMCPAVPRITCFIGLPRKRTFSIQFKKGNKKGHVPSTQFFSTFPSCPFPFPLSNLTLRIHHGSSLDPHGPPDDVDINPFGIRGKKGIVPRKIGLSRLGSLPISNVEILWKKYRTKKFPSLVRWNTPNHSLSKNNKKCQYFNKLWCKPLQPW
jgi:hypothetical protein